MLYKRTIDRVLILIVPAALFVYASTRPQVRLRADMPPDFVDVPTSAAPSRRAEEERVAREYWNCALNVLQWKYTYGYPLPAAPPEEFQAKVKSSADSELVSPLRMRYWQRLQKAWLLPSSWTTSREWSTDWLTEPLKKGLNWIEDYFKDLIRRD